jgi:hypothetical protein
VFESLGVAHHSTAEEPARQLVVRIPFVLSRTVQGSIGLGVFPYGPAGGPFGKKAREFGVVWKRGPFRGDPSQSLQMTCNLKHGRYSEQ